jgi:hypothetical protein
VIDPDRGVDQDHAGPLVALRRSLTERPHSSLMARSPSFELWLLGYAEFAEVSVEGEDPGAVASCDGRK